MPEISDIQDILQWNQMIFHQERQLQHMQCITCYLSNVILLIVFDEYDLWNEMEINE